MIVYLGILISIFQYHGPGYNVITFMIVLLLNNVLIRAGSGISGAHHGLNIGSEEAL